MYTLMHLIQIGMCVICYTDIDCPDSSDEIDCPNNEKLCSGMPGDLIRCGNTTSCIMDSWWASIKLQLLVYSYVRFTDGMFFIPFRKCDGEEDCFAGSDEIDCPKITCGEDKFQCTNGHCISIAWRCGKLLHIKFVHLLMIENIKSNSFFLHLRKMGRLIAQPISPMRITVTWIVQTLFVSRTIFNVPMAKIAFRQRGNGKNQLSFVLQKTSRKKLIKFILFRRRSQSRLCGKSSSNAIP